MEELATKSNTKAGGPPADEVAEWEARIAQVDAAQRGERFVDGGTFALDQPPGIPAVWGEGDRILHAKGESTLFVAPKGVGKTTLSQQFGLRRAGIRGGDLLGLPVAVGSGRVLYLALDRPRQAARSLRRMVAESDRTDLALALVVWQGPLAFDLGRADPGELAAFVATVPEVDTLIIDGLGAATSGLDTDEVGSRVNLALQTVVANGVEVLALHHQRKAQSDNKRPRSLDDVYGSGWLTAGAGSVVLLWGAPGDPLVDLVHLKQPAAEVGPLSLSHDQRAGTFTLHEARDLYAMVQAATTGGLSPREAAIERYGTADPSRNEVEKCRRELDRMAAERRIAKAGEGSGHPVLYRPLERRLG